MSLLPETRSSLIARIVDVGDADAWRDFSSLYEPFIYRQARRYGLQHEDAQELVQDVLLAVSRAVGRFTVDPQKGRFRTWLYAVGRNVCLQHLRRIREREDASGGTSDVLSDLADPQSLRSRELDTELKRHAFLWVARHIRGEFHAKTWDCFWRTAVQNHSIQNTAEELGMSVGAIYVARSRVMARLRARVQEITLDGLDLFDRESHDPPAVCEDNGDPSDPASRLASSAPPQGKRAV